MPSKIDLFHGDNRRLLRALRARGVQFDSAVTDPPYGLTSIVKRFGAPGAQAARTEGTDGSFSRLSGGFMGKKWDGTQIERDPAFWRLVFDVLKPGAYCFAFSGSRTGHWQACAMEQAGFIMHPMHGWVFGSGFPKAHSVAAAGPEWEGWAHSTQAQKPALEPIYLAQKPFSEKTGVANILKHGVGAVNIAACRVPGEKPATTRGASSKASSMSGTMNGQGRIEDDGMGRYPSNLILDGSPEVGAMFPNEADRFFHQFGYEDADLDEMRAMGLIGDDQGPPLFYHPKAGGNDRHGGKHPTVKPIALMQYLIRHITPKGGKVLDPFAGSGTTGIAARREGCDCTLIEQEDEYMAFLGKRLGVAPQKIAHRVRVRP